MSLEKRVKNLEQKTGAGKPESKTWVIVDGEPEPVGIAEKDLVIRVVDQHTKDLIAQVEERTRKLTNASNTGR